MKTSSLLSLLVAAIVAPMACAQTAPLAPSSAPATPEVAPATSPAYTITATASAVSQYMFRGTRLGGAAFQPAVEYGAGDLALGVWASFPMKDKVVGQSDPEIDLYGSYKIALNDQLSLVPGFTWYNYPNADEANGWYKNTFEPSLAVNYTVGAVLLTPKVYYDTTLEGATYELNIGFALPLKSLGTELAFLGQVGTFKWDNAWENTSPAMKNWGDYYLVGVTLPYQITSNSKLSIGLAYTKGESNFLKQGTTPKYENTAAVGRGVVTVSYALTF